MAYIPNAVLWVRGGPADGTYISLSKGTTLFGRDQGNHVVVDESGVSRQHAAIRTDEIGYWIEDLGSRNGTFVNGEELEGEGIRLRDADRIELGGGGTVYWIFREQDATVWMAPPLIE